MEDNAKNMKHQLQ